MQARYFTASCYRFVVAEGAPLERGSRSVYHVRDYFGISRCDNLHAVSGLVQALAYFLGDHHGTVLAAGAAKADREIALAFVDVVRQQVNQQIGNAEDEFLGLRK